MGPRRGRLGPKKAEPEAPSRLWKAATLAFGVAWLAALMRWWPLTQYNIWGSDQGEYAGLIETYLGTGGRMPPAYDGWGVAYPDFTGMFAFAGAFSQISGVDSFYILSVVVPAAAALSALFAFVITLRLSRSLFAATVAGLIVATAMPEVFASSHGMPGALGGMLLLAMVAAAVVSVRTPAARGVVLVVALALVPTHHLSAFLGVCIFSATALLEARLGPSDVDRSRIIDTSLLAAITLLLGSAAFWAWGAPGFREGVLGQSAPTLARTFPGLALIAAVGLVIATWFLESRPRDTKRFRATADDRKTAQRLAVAGLSTLVAVGVLVAAGVPGTSAAVAPAVALPFIPLGFTLGAAAAGPSRLIPARGSLILVGGLLGVIASGAVGALLAPTVLIPYRHMQYFVDLAAPLAAVGLAFAARGAAAQMFPGRRALARAMSALLVALLVAGCAASAYPPKAALAGFQEGTVDTEVAALVWMTWQVPSAYVATDHRMSSMAFGFAYQDATWEAGGPILVGDAATALPRLDTVESPSGSVNVSLVLLSRDIKEGAALTQWDPAAPVQGPALAKFDAAPFVRVFDNGDAVVWWVAR